MAEGGLFLSMTMSENGESFEHCLFETICHFNCRNFLPIFKSNSLDLACNRPFLLPHSVVIVVVIAVVVEVGQKGVICVCVCLGLMCRSIIVCVLRFALKCLVIANNLILSTISNCSNDCFSEITGTEGKLRDFMGNI